MGRDTRSVRVAGVAVLQRRILVRGHRGRGKRRLGDIAGIEHSTVSVSGAPPEAYELRVATIFRREDGEWKVVHRHADPMPDSESARLQVARLGDLRPLHRSSVRFRSGAAVRRRPEANAGLGSHSAVGFIAGHVSGTDISWFSRCRRRGTAIYGRPPTRTSISHDGLWRARTCARDLSSRTRLRLRLCGGRTAGR